MLSFTKSVVLFSQRIVAINRVNKCNLLSSPTTSLTGKQKMQSLDSKQMSEVRASYECAGFAVVPNFFSETEIDSMRSEALRLIKEESRHKSNKKHVFGNEINMKSRHFLDSSDQICYFFEKNAFDPETQQLQLPEEQSLAKIAHALHACNPLYKEASSSRKVQDLFRAIGFIQPTIVQSMIIFKNPKVGGAYTPHQDASFLYAEPIHLAGIWIAMDDATPENGCLEFILGSHKWPLARRYVRTENTEDGENLLEWTAPVKEYDESQFVKVPVKRGDVVLIHGLVVHRSAANVSEKPRWIYTFHAFDQGRSRYCEKNWLQINKSNTFLSLYDKGTRFEAESK